MRIAQFCPYDFERPGGVQRHIRDLAAALRGLGHRVTVIAPHSPRPHHASSQLPGEELTQIGGARTVRINKTTFEVTLASAGERRRLSKLLAGNAFDLIHFHTIHTPFLSLQAFSCATAATVATFHDVPPDFRSLGIEKAFYRTLGRWLLPRLDGAIFASETVGGYWPMARAPAAAIIPPCTNLLSYAAAQAPMAEFRDAKINILFLGRLEPRKGAIVLLDAFRTLQRAGSNVRLLIVGDGSERVRLERFVAANALRDVVFLGEVADIEVPSWYATADVFCAPSLDAEGFGIVLTQALASERPVVASDIPGYRSVLKGELAELLTPPGDASALARLLARLVGDAALRHRLGEEGRRVWQSYDCGSVAPRVVAIYEQALARGSSAMGRVRNAGA